MFGRYAATALAPMVVLTLAGGLHAQDDDGPALDAYTIGLTADGTWDCRDATGNYLGAIVVADESYAYLGPDGAASSYGKLYREHYLSPPALIIISGALKEDFGAVGLTLRGPGDTPQDYSDWSAVDMHVIITETSEFPCVRRSET